MARTKGSKNIKKDEDRHYIDKDEFRELLKESYETGVVNEALGKNILDIAIGLSKKGNFNGYTYKEEMISMALVRMMAAVKNKKFDFEKSAEPFSYFTSIAWYAFLEVIKKEKKRSETMKEYREHVYEKEQCENPYYAYQKVEKSEIFDEEYSE